MKILAINMARAIWLFPTVLLNPRGRNILASMEAFAARYKFAKVPEPKSFVERPTKLVFEGGSFIGSNGEPITVGFTIHDDGIIGDTRASTGEADAFLHDALSWFSAENQLPSYSDFSVKKLYSSEICVHLEKPLTIFNKKFSSFTNRLKSGISNNPGVPLELVQLTFSPDRSSTNTKTVVPFKLERMVEASFSDNQFYSYAPVPTDEHLELLSAFEEAAS